ncbi:hypothetical protein ACFPRL_24055 [Pseudoclavibacter helvolus]
MRELCDCGTTKVSATAACAPLTSPTRKSERAAPRVKTGVSMEAPDGPCAFATSSASLASSADSRYRPSVRSAKALKQRSSQRRSAGRSLGMRMPAAICSNGLAAFRSTGLARRASPSTNARIG